MSAHAAFLESAKSCFAFLTSEFGFMATDQGEGAAGAWITYEKRDRRVVVNFEHGSGSWIELSELQRAAGDVISKKSYNLERLLRLRGLPTPADTLATSERLAQLAGALRQYFSDFLRGESL